jgi:cytochrome b6-f complex iron-sulfur subunit
MPSNGPEALSVDRRGFLNLATRLLLGIAGGSAIVGLGRYLSYEPPTSRPTHFTLEPPDAYPAGTQTVIAEAGVVVGRDDGGLFARSLTCAHLGCRVHLSEDGGFACPCHGSRFSKVGDRVVGPAPRSLDGVAISVDDHGRLEVDVSQKVDSAWRLGVDTAGEPIAGEGKG